MVEEGGYGADEFYGDNLNPTSSSSSFFIFYITSSPHARRYGNSSGYGENMSPKLTVYSSPTLASGTWVNHGRLDVLGNWSWPTKPVGTFYTPWAVVNPATGKVVLWFNAYMNGACFLGRVGTPPTSLPPPAGRLRPYRAVLAGNEACPSSTTRVLLSVRALPLTSVRGTTELE